MPTALGDKAASKREFLAERQKVSAQRPVERATLAARALEDPLSLSSSEVLQLQSSLGNRAVAELFRDRSPAQEAIAGDVEPDQLIAEEVPSKTTVHVGVVFKKGSNGARVHAVNFSPASDARTAKQTVGPTGTPTVHGSGGNSCLPNRPTLTWAVADAGANWRADVTAMNVSGTIRITPWPNNPTSMTVPNTPNPVDGGNINNTAGSANHWQAAVDDLADYDTPGGGRGPNWHSTAASSAHEYTHWNVDFLGDAIPTANWTQANLDIDALTVPKAANPTAVAARAALEPMVTARFTLFADAVIARWNTIITTTDTPGSGGRGYAAGQTVLNGHIAAIQAYRASKGW